MTNDALKLLEQLRQLYVESEHPHRQVWTFQPGEENETKTFHELRALEYVEQIGAHGSPWRLTAKGHSWVLQRLPLSTDAQEMLKWLKEQLVISNYRSFTFTPQPETQKIINELRGHGYIEQSGAHGSPWQLTRFGQQRLLN